MVVKKCPHCRYVPKGPDGVSTVLVGGDRLTEANCRNIQWAFEDGATKEDRLEGMVFKFEDWHAIRVLFEVSNQSQINLICGVQFTRLNLFTLLAMTQSYATDQEALSVGVVLHFLCFSL